MGRPIAAPLSGRACQLTALICGVLPLLPLFRKRAWKSGNAIYAANHGPQDLLRFLVGELPPVFCSYLRRYQLLRMIGFYRLDR